MFFFLFINSCLLLYSIFHLIRYILFSKSIKVKKMNNQDNVKYNLVIVIPCLNEHNTIVDTVKYFKRIIKNTNIPIILVTTNKEKSSFSTKDIIEKEIIDKYDNVFLCHYPKEVGVMADQLNYSVEHLKNYLPINYSEEETYYCVYNADSRPNKNTFDELVNCIKNNNYPLVIQQYSYAFSNYNNLSFISKGFAMYQSNFEIKIGLLNSYFDNIVFHKHLVGHGLFIRLDLLKKLNGFNNKFWCEDIYMTAAINNLDIKITPMLCLENMETPDKLSKIIKQNSVWFSTSFNNLKIYNDVFKNQNKISIRGLFGWISELRSAINWLFFPIIILINLLISYKLGFIFFIISLVNYSNYVFIYSLTTIKLINKLNDIKIKYNFEHLITTFIATIISNFGPLYYLIFRPKEKYKTER